MEKLLVVDDKYNLKGLITVKDIQKKLKYPDAAKDVAGTPARRRRDRRHRRLSGARPGDWRSAKSMCWPSTAPTDIPRCVLEAVKTVKAKLPEVDLIAGNVATFDGACELVALEPTAVKVGIGPGSICTTRIVTGAGVPQITAIAEAYRADQRLRRSQSLPTAASSIPAISPRPWRRARAAVMIGSLFAGTDESPGELILYQGRTFKSYRGMGSLGAMAAGIERTLFPELPMETLRRRSPVRWRRLEPPGQAGSGRH